MFIFIFILALVLFVFLSYNIVVYKEPFTSKRKCFTSKMNKNELNALYFLVNTTGKILNKEKIDWIPCSGNLLAIYRHNSLIIPWDDDYDMVVNKKQETQAIDILTKKLPKYNCKISKWTTRDGCTIYKIYLEKNHPIYGQFLTDYHDHKKKKIWKINYTWPFIDLFVGDCKRKTPLTSASLLDEEYPLKKVIINGLTLRHPTKGLRSYKSFKEKGYLNTLLEDGYSHKHEKRMECKGNKIKYI